MRLAEHLIDAMVRDLTIMQHLYSKIPAGSLDFRPRENMRSLHELLHYISNIGGVVIRVFENSTEHKEDMAQLRSLTPPYAEFNAENFHEIIEEEKRIIKRVLEPLSDEDFFATKVYQPWREHATLLSGILNGPLKYLTAYRMQLFLYLKELGVEINTANNWTGKDWNPPPKVAETA